MLMSLNLMSPYNTRGINIHSYEQNIKNVHHLNIYFNNLNPFLD